MQLAVLLRNGMHAAPTGDTRAAPIRYALQCDSVAIQFQKTPIQIPIPQQSPELFDLGIVRPSITISGIVDTVGGDTSNTSVAGVEHMSSINVTRNYWAWASSASSYTSSTQTYYVPYKNKLEEAVYTWIAEVDNDKIAILELEIGDANYPIYGDAAETNENHVTDHSVSLTNASGTSLTGGAVYQVAIQSCRFQLDPAMEDRYTFQMQFVATARKDVIFPAQA